MTSDNQRGEKAARLICRYEYQLLSGCRNAECTEVLCFTGRNNISDHPIRRYTARSAKIMAMAVCAGPNPYAHLCRHEDLSMTSIPPFEQRRDPSSLSQLLGDTQAVQSANVSQIKCDPDLASNQQLLSKLLLAGPSWSRVLIDKISPCMDWLLDTLPEQRSAVWEMIDREVISKGFEAPARSESRPSDDRWNTWVAALDALNNQPRLYLLERMMLVVGRKMNEEQTFDTHRSEAPQPPLWTGKESYGVVDMLTLHLINRGKSHAHIPLATIIWLKRLFAKTWDGKPVVTRGSVAHVILEILQSLHSHGSIKTRDAFKMPLIRLRLSDTDLASTWESSGLHHKTKHILNFQYLFSAEQLLLCFRTVNLLRMSLANGSAMKVNEYRRRHSIDRSELEQEPLPPQLQHQEEHYLLLYVSRVHLLKDSFDQLWHRRPRELRRPLRVRMGADQLDIGHDLGGVQVEFFNTICKHIFSNEAQMFTTSTVTGLSYFTPGSLQPLHMFELFGLLLSLAVYNGITLPIRLPLVLYHIITKCQLPRAPAMIQDAWPEMARGLSSLLETYVEDLDFAFPLEANGVSLSCIPKLALSEMETPGLDSRFDLLVATVSSSSGETQTISDVAKIEHAWPGWKFTMSTKGPEPVTPDNIELYIEAYSRWLVLVSVRPQLRAFLRGFSSSKLIDEQTLSLLGPARLKAYVEGTDTLNISELRAATRYEDYVATEKYIASFWRVVTSWPQEKQKLLLKFVTAAERIPITGAKQLTFVIKKAQPDSLDALPTSSTCFGTLLLPRYASAEIMAEKLSLALKYGAEGFGAG